MKRDLFLALLMIGLVLPALSPTLRAQQLKTARGSITAIATNSVTIKVRDTEMKFAVDTDTAVVATGGSHEAAAARAAGMPGPKVTDVLKAGDPVSISYRDGGGTPRATRIRVVPSAAHGGGAISTEKPATKTASGTVKSVAAGLLTIGVAGGPDMSFTIAASTLVVGTGIGTQAAAKGGKARVGEFVSTGDRVSVSYHEMNGTMHASRVQVN